MKICILTVASGLADQLRRAAQAALSAPITDLSTVPLSAWKDSIKVAELVLVDFTAANSTASYVVGLADALNKRVILLAPISDPIPAVFKKHRIIVHQWNLELLKTELQSEATPSEPIPQIAEDTPAGKFHQLFGDLLKAHGYIHRGPVEFDGSTFTVREQDMDLALVQEIAHRARTLNVRVRLL